MAEDEENSEPKPPPLAPWPLLTLPGLALLASALLPFGDQSLGDIFAEGGAWSLWVCASALLGALGLALLLWLSARAPALSAAAALLCASLPGLVGAGASYFPLRGIAEEAARPRGGSILDLFWPMRASEALLAQLAGAQWSAALFFGAALSLWLLAALHRRRREDALSLGVVSLASACLCASQMVGRGLTLREIEALRAAADASPTRARSLLVEAAEGLEGALAAPLWILAGLAATLFLLLAAARAIRRGRDVSFAGPLGAALGSLLVAAALILGAPRLRAAGSEELEAARRPSFGEGSEPIAIRAQSGEIYGGAGSYGRLLRAGPRGLEGEALEGSPIPLREDDLLKEALRAHRGEGERLDLLFDRGLEAASLRALLDAALGAGVRELRVFALLESDQSAEALRRARRVFPTAAPLYQPIARVEAGLLVQPPPEAASAYISESAEVELRLPRAGAARAETELHLSPLGEGGELDPALRDSLLAIDAPIVLLYDERTEARSLLRATAVILAAGQRLWWAQAPRPTTTQANAIDAQQRAPIQIEMRAHMEEFQSCYESAREGSPALAGRLLARFAVWPDGSTREIEIAQDTLGDEGLRECIRARIREIRFPPPTGERAITVSYPLVFRPAP